MFAAQERLPARVHALRIGVIDLRLVEARLAFPARRRPAGAAASARVTSACCARSSRRASTAPFSTWSPTSARRSTSTPGHLEADLRADARFDRAKPEDLHRHVRGGSCSLDRYRTQKRTPGSDRRDDDRKQRDAGGEEAHPVSSARLCDNAPRRRFGEGGHLLRTRIWNFKHRDLPDRSVARAFLSRQRRD